MASKTNLQGAATLKQISYRISSTPVNELPRLVPQIATSLWTCRHLLSSTSPTTKQGSDDGIAVHRFKTQLSTLLQDRTVEGRWAGVVLVKATVEAGGLEVLSKANGWVKNLLGFLKKPDPATTRNLAVITLTRIFMLTWDHANLVREITTPALPTFISTCLGNVENKRCSPSELQMVLEAFATLVPRHPTTFRTHESQIRVLLTRIISSTAASTGASHYTQSHISTAERLLVLLHHCAPKQGMADKWDNTVKTTVSAAHATCDRVFRSVIEDWRSAADIQPSVPAHRLVAGDMEFEGEDAAGMTGWKGVYSGSERLISHLELLSAHLDTATAGIVTVRLGLITDLITRVLSVAVPLPGKQDFTKPNQQISKDERDVLYSLLPRVHSTVLRLIESIMNRFGSAVLSILPSLTTQVNWVFRAEKANELLRTAAYNVLAKTLALAGPTLGKHEIVEITVYMTACCNDLLPPEDLATTTASTLQTPTSTFQSSKSLPSHATQPSDVQAAASALLPVLLAKLNPKHVPRKLRAQIDRTAILTKHKPALLASVLNPALNASGTGTQASLLPFLARLFPGDAEVEALVRPRMPIILTGKTKSASGGVSEEPEEEEEDDEEDDEGEGEEQEEDENPAEPADNAIAIDAMDVPEAAGGARDALDASTTAEPDLLTALDEHLGSTGFSNSAETDASRRPAASHASSLAPKRSAAATGSSETAVPAKRPRPANMAETLLPRAGGVGNLSVQEAGRNEVLTVPGSATAAAVAVTRDEGSDDSDFEVPPLTMQQDTEDEDDEEEGDEE